ncbi:hypothetical protein INR49_028055 [Caranx melampygus]|nr:hypothetical protein INR49_028055 [Caranx melampygus]
MGIRYGIHWVLKMTHSKEEEGDENDEDASPGPGRKSLHQYGALCWDHVAQYQHVSQSPAYSCSSCLRFHLFSRIDHQHNADYRQYQQHNRRDVVAESHAGDQGRETGFYCPCDSVPALKWPSPSAESADASCLNLRASLGADPSCLHPTRNTGIRTSGRGSGSCSNLLGAPCWGFTGVNCRAEIRAGRGGGSRQLLQPHIKPLHCSTLAGTQLTAGGLGSQQNRHCGHAVVERGLSRCPIDGGDGGQKNLRALRLCPPTAGRPREGLLAFNIKPESSVIPVTQRAFQNLELTREDGTRHLSPQ